MSTIAIPQSFTPATPAQWLASELGVAATVGLDTTSWQPGDPSLALLTLFASGMAQSDVLVSLQNQGGFLDTAATGSVTFQTTDSAGATRPTTQYVTPDPSIPAQNSTGALGWLDILADNFFDVQRVPPTYASGNENLVNSTASSYGPFAPGSYHVANPSTGATYSNTATLTIAPNATTVAAFAADVAGTGGTSGTGTITQAVTSLLGVTVTNPPGFVGSNYESNVALAARCRLKRALISPNGATDAARFVTLSATVSPYNVVLAGGPITRVLVQLNTANGVVTETIANAGGLVSGPDVTAINNLLQATVVPDTTTLVVQSATTLAVAFAVTVFVPSAYAGVAGSAVSTQITNYLAVLPIGGLTDTGGAYTNVLPFDAVLGQVFQAANYIQQATLLLNGSTSDVAIGVTQVVVASSITVTVRSET